jgi:branched-chain amino acid transport system substrate-binding protein
MKNFMCVFAAAAIYFMGLVTCSAEPSISHASPFKIGVILGLSGPTANFGVIARNGVELALKDLTAEDRARIQVLYEDDGMTNIRAATAAQKLISSDEVDALMSWSSGSGLTVAGIAEAKQIPHISIASDPAVVKGRTYSFTYWPIPRDEVVILHDYLAKHGIKRVAVLTMIHNGALAIRDEFVEVAKKGGQVSVVASEEVAGDTTDFRTVLNRIKRKGDIDGLIPILFPGQLAVSVKQAREVGIKAPLFGFETFEDKDEFKASGGLLAGAIYSTGADPRPDFISRYRAAFGDASYYTANQAYDIIHLLVEASKKTKDPQAVVSFLQGLRDYPTASGPATSTGDNRFHLPCALKVLDPNGDARSLEEK